MNTWNYPATPYVHNHFDSRRWEEIELRDGDVVISTYPKSGTTREQMTILQIVYNGKEGLNITELSPYVELCIEPIAEVVERLSRQNERRVIKAHLPIDYLPYSPHVRYIDVWRNPFDVAVSLYHHHNNANENYFVGTNDNRPKNTELFEANELAPREWILRWLKQDGFPYWSFQSHIESWWNQRHLDNVMIFHFADLHVDRVREVLRRAEFLGVDVKTLDIETIMRLTSFEYMKRNSAHTAPYGGTIWGTGTGKEFFRKGTGGDWKTILTADDVTRCTGILRETIPEDAYTFLVR